MDEQLDVYLECNGFDEEGLKQFGFTEMKVLGHNGEETDDGYSQVCVWGAKRKFKIFVNDKLDEEVYIADAIMDKILTKIVNSQVRHEIGVIDLGKSEVYLYN
jgi:hypothetical protein